MRCEIRVNVQGGKEKGIGEVIEAAVMTPEPNPNKYTEVIWPTLGIVSVVYRTDCQGSRPIYLFDHFPDEED